jgi:hypothetical protein
MKMLIGAVALALAVPAVAQTAPAADPHAVHAQPMDHSPHKAGEHDCKECCEKMKQQDGKMECMDEKAEAKPAGDAGVHQDHASH